MDTSGLDANLWTHRVDPPRFVNANGPLIDTSVLLQNVENGVADVDTMLSMYDLTYVCSDMQKFQTSVDDTTQNVVFSAVGCKVLPIDMSAAAEAVWQCLAKSTCEDSQYVSDQCVTVRYHLCCCLVENGNRWNAGI